MIVVFCIGGFLFVNLVQAEEVEEISSTTATVDNTVLWDDLKIGKIEYNVTTGSEWVGIYNSGTSAVDLSGGVICDSTEKNCKSTGGIIHPLQTLNIILNTKRYLNNDGDSVILKNPNKKIIDRIDYTKKKKNLAVPRINKTITEIYSTPTSWKRGIKLTIVTTTKNIQATSSMQSTSIEQEKFLLVSSKQARSMEKGVEIKVAGVIAVMPGVLGGQYLYITKENNGIQVYSYKKDFPRLKLGYFVEVTGQMSSANGVQRIKIVSSSDIVVLSSGNKIMVATKKIGELNENNLGGLVQIVGNITEKKSNYFYIDDGVDEIKVVIKDGTQIDKKNYKVGDKLEVIGIVESSRDDLVILPRSEKDIRKIKVYVAPKKSISNIQKISTKPAVQKKQAIAYLNIAVVALLILIILILVRKKILWVIKKATS